MDPQLTEAVLEAFVKLHEEGFVRSIDHSAPRLT